MTKKFLFLSALSLSLLSFHANKGRAQTAAPVRFMSQRGVTRVAAMETTGLAGFTYDAAADFMKATRDNVAQKIPLNLFPDVSMVMEVRRIERGGSNVTWYGAVQDAPYSSAALVLTQSGLVGAITRGDGKMYQIRTAEDGSRWVLEIDQSKFPDEAVPMTAPPPTAADRTVARDAPVSSDDGSTIDVMVLYTAAARLAAGGTTAMQQLVQLGIAETNQGYMNSGVIQRVRLVESREVDYTEAPTISTDLSRMASPSDGFLDNIPTLRNTYGADLVSLWVSTPESICGIGYQMTDPTPSISYLQQIAYSVAELDCATGYYTFGHEMGHNMGANHGRDDVGVGQPGPAYPYGYGYKQTAVTPKFRTIMAYDTNCSVGSPGTELEFAL